MSKLRILPFAAALFFCAYGAFSDEDDAGFVTFGEEPFGEWDGDSSDIDIIFGGASDCDTVVETVVESEQPSVTIGAGGFFVPLTFSGSLEGSLGYGYIKNLDSEAESPGNSAYFNLTNYLYFTARPDKYLSVRGAFKTEMPKSGSASLVSANFSLYELYMTYLLFDRIYINAGKKTTTWGNIRLFSNDDDFSKADTDALFTNILSDSLGGISGSVTVPLPWLQSNVSAVALLSDELFASGGSTTSLEQTSVSPALMSYAFSFDCIVRGFLLTFEARKFPSRSRLEELDGANSTHFVDTFHQYPILGFEAKKTVFGFDIYGQELVRIFDVGSLKNAFGGDFSSVQKLSTTGGFYRWWDLSACSFGFNAEFQSVFNHLDNNGGVVNDVVNRLAFEGGVKRLGSGHDWRVLGKLIHNFTESSGVLTVAVTNSGILPHADWRTGVEYSYGDDEKKITLGSYVKLNLSY